MDFKDWKKINVTEQIYSRTMSLDHGVNAIIRFKDLPPNLLPTDIIDIERIDAHYSENNSWEAQTVLKVYRERLETDEEFEKRKNEKLKFIEEIRERRYNTYLELKKEFEK